MGEYARYQSGQPTNDTTGEKSAAEREELHRQLTTPGRVSVQGDRVEIDTPQIVRPVQPQAGEIVMKNGKEFVVLAGWRRDARRCRQSGGCLPYQA